MLIDVIRSLFLSCSKMLCFDLENFNTTGKVEDMKKETTMICFVVLKPKIVTIVVETICFSNFSFHEVKHMVEISFDLKNIFTFFGCWLKKVL